MEVDPKHHHKGICDRPSNEAAPRRAMEKPSSACRVSTGVSSFAATRLESSGRIPSSRRILTGNQEDSHGEPRGGLLICVSSKRTL